MRIQTQRDTFAFTAAGLGSRAENFADLLMNHIDTHGQPAEPDPYKWVEQMQAEYRGHPYAQVSTPAALSALYNRLQRRPQLRDWSEQG